MPKAGADPKLIRAPWAAIHVNDDVLVGVERAVGRHTADRIWRIRKRDRNLFSSPAPALNAAPTVSSPARVFTPACLGVNSTRPRRDTKHEWRRPVWLPTVIADGGRCVAGSNVPVPHDTTVGVELVDFARAAATRSDSRESGPNRGRGAIVFGDRDERQRLADLGAPLTCVDRDLGSNIGANRRAADAGANAPIGLDDVVDERVFAQRREGLLGLALCRRVRPVPSCPSRPARTLKTKRLRRGWKCS